MPLRPESPAGRRPTMRDVAQEAGVSQSLVSMVFRDVPGASRETRERVLQVARDMGYVRNESARSLRSQRPTALGVLFRTHQPFHDEVIDGLYLAAAQASRDLMLSAASEQRGEEAAVRELVGHRCGALVLLGPRADDAELLAWAGHVPVVVVARRSGSARWVVADDSQGMRAVVVHLVGLGHRDLAYLSAPEEAGGRERLAAVRQAVEAQEAKDVRLRIVPAGITEDSGAAAVEELLAQGPPPTAIIAFNDRCALGVLEVLRERGLRVPEDVSVVGYDDSSIARRATTDLTTVRQDSAALASHAIACALAALDQGEGDGVEVTEASPGPGVIVPVELVVRSSTGPAPDESPEEGRQGGGGRPTGGSGV